MANALGPILFLTLASFHAAVSLTLFRYPEWFKRLSCDLALFEAQKNWIRGWPSQYLQVAGWMFGFFAGACVLVALVGFFR